MSRIRLLLRRRRGERGAAAVEMALILPVLLLLVGGIIDFGRAFNAQMTLTQAAREGARMQSLGYTDAQVASRARQAATGLPTIAVNIPSRCPTTDPSNASVVEVSTNFNYLLLDGIVNLVGASMPASQTLRAQGSMRCSG